MVSIPDGQVLEAVLCFLDESPRPNVLFGAPVSEQNTTVYLQFSYLSQKAM
jgi:hypothetical protein